ncbi:MAG: hypothetical protein ACJ79A_19520 [Gemmatimonadaceae bacterium]
MPARSISRSGATVTALGGVIVAAIIAACAGPDMTGALAAGDPMMHAAADNPNSAAGDTKGFIMGWLDGETVQLRYTRLYFCAEPPSSAAPSDCEVGADPAVFPREGPIPKIYALAPVGFSPDPATVACGAGTVCLNHPATLDLSRVGGPAVAPAAAHSHIITDRQAGWHQTVNIRVTSLAVWNEIAAAKTLTKVRELQAAGRLGPDNATNIFFFFEVQQPTPAP